MRASLISIIMTFSLAGCSLLPEKVRAVNKPDPVGKEYAVYAALLNKIGSSPEDGSGVKLLVVNNQTSGDMVTGSQPEEVFKDYKETLSSEFQAALKDYKAKNQKSERLVRSFNLNLDYLLVNRNEFQAFFKSKNLEESWKKFL